MRDKIDEFLAWWRQIDQGCLCDVFDLALGWFTGRGYSHDNALAAAERIRDETEDERRTGYREGERVVATSTITEGGTNYPGDPLARFPDPQYIHAVSGDLGTIVGIDAGMDDAITIRFDRTGTATFVADEEFNPL